MPQKFQVGDKVEIKVGFLKGEIRSITGISNVWISKKSRKLYYICDYHYYSHELKRVKKQK